MNKEQFLTAIRDSVKGLPQDDVERSLEYYSEMIDDRIEDGMTPEQAVADMGTVAEISAQILADTPLPKLVKEKVRPSRALRAWEIILIALGSPIWLTLLLCVLTVFLSVYIVIWSLVVVLFSVVVSLGIGAVAGIVCFAYLLRTGELLQAVLMLGIGLIFGGLAILTFIGSAAAAVGIAKLSRMIFMWIKSRFIKKGEVQ